VVCYLLTRLGAAADAHNYCYTYAVLRERPAARRLTVCGRRQRQAVIFTSLSNAVQVRIIRPRNSRDDDEAAAHFLLEYRGLRFRVLIATIRYDTRCCFNVRSKADVSRLNLPHGNDN